MTYGKRMRSPADYSFSDQRRGFDSEKVPDKEPVAADFGAKDGKRMRYRPLFADFGDEERFLSESRPTDRHVSPQGYQNQAGAGADFEGNNSEQQLRAADRLNEERENRSAGDRFSASPVRERPSLNDSHHPYNARQPLEDRRGVPARTPHADPASPTDSPSKVHADARLLHRPATLFPEEHSPSASPRARPGVHDGDAAASAGFWEDYAAHAQRSSADQAAFTTIARMLLHPAQGLGSSRAAESLLEIFGRMEASPDGAMPYVAPWRQPVRDGGERAVLARFWDNAIWANDRGFHPAPPAAAGDSPELAQVVAASCRALVEERVCRGRNVFEFGD